MKSIYELLPNEIKEQGYTQEIILSIYPQMYIRKQCETLIELVEYAPKQVETLKGTMIALPGMYIATGVNDEKYVITKDILDVTYDPVLNKPNYYTKKRYPVIAQVKDCDFLVPNEYAKTGFLKGKAGSILIQSMIIAKDIYPIDREVFVETYELYSDYLKNKYGVDEEEFAEESTEISLQDGNIFTRFIGFIKKIFKKDDNLI